MLNTQIFVLSEREKERIATVLSRHIYHPSGDDIYVNEMRIQAFKYFPERFLAKLLELSGNAALSTPYIIVHNLPVDTEITGSPSFYETGSQFKNGTLTENLLTAVGAVIGEPYSIAHEGQELVNNLTPHLEHSNEFTGLGSQVELDFHIENAAQHYLSTGDISPLALILLGIRSQAGVPGPLTRLADSRLALAQLDQDDLHTLSSPSFVIRVPYRWRNATPTPQENTGLVPLISGAVGQPRVTVAFYPDMVLPINKTATAAFRRFYDAIKEVAIGVEISPGCMVIINNKFTLHSRDAFTPQFDENKRAYRWIQRVFVSESLWNFRGYSRIGSRIFEPKIILSESTAPSHAPELVH